MQRIEARCVLDSCSKKVAKKHPKMLLISRHDSLSTTEKDFELLKDELQKLLNMYFDTEVELDNENW